MYLLCKGALTRSDRRSATGADLMEFNFDPLWIYCSQYCALLYRYAVKMQCACICCIKVRWRGVIGVPLLVRTWWSLTLTLHTDGLHCEQCTPPSVRSAHLQYCKRLKVSTFIHPTYGESLTSSGLQFEVVYWLTMTLGGAAQVAAAHWTDFGPRSLQPDWPTNVPASRTMAFTRMTSHLYTSL